MRILAELSRKRSTLLALGIAILMISGVVLPAYSDHIKRANVYGIVEVIESGHPTLQKACSNGAFDAIRAPFDLRLKPSEGSAFIQNATFEHRAPGRLEITFALADFGPAWSSVPGDRRDLSVEYNCTPTKQFSTRVGARSTVYSLYLPSRLKR